MYSVLRPILFRLDPELTHKLSLYALRFASSIPPLSRLVERAYTAPDKPVSAFGLRFRNAVGLAAGYDKDGLAIRGLTALGFGHLEIGTVTPRPQPGNPRPRLFRLPEDEAVINRLGFPSKGAEHLAQRLHDVRPSTVDGEPPAVHLLPSTVLGINLGKNKDTPLEAASEDYLSLMARFSTLSDYLTINISSPNTEGLQRLQGRDMLESLLQKIGAGRTSIAQARGVKPPILIKLSPDLTDHELEDAVGIILDQGMDGLIVTNTTRLREGLRSARRGEEGGLSGRPLGVRSEAVLRQAVRLVGGRVPIVSVGGIMSVEDAKRRLDLGATLIQVYTGLVYHGPGFVNTIVRYL